MVKDQWIEQVHRPGYAKRIAAACLDGQGWIDTPDVAVSKESEQVARYATGSLITLVDKVISKENDNGFALVRPPGHHANMMPPWAFAYTTASPLRHDIYSPNTTLNGY